MEFVNPWFLTGLSAIAIPIFIHLFNFHRYRKVYFTNVRFLKSIKVQTQKQSRLRSLIILVTRILAIICVVMAFAQPFIPKGKLAIKPGATNAISIYVDNSMSMQASGEKGMLIDMAKEKVIDLLTAYAPTDVFQLTTNDLEGRHQHFVTKEQFRAYLSEVKLSPSVRPLSEIVRYQQNLLDKYNATNKAVFLVSDFQRSTFFNQHEADSIPFPLIMIPLKAVISSNIAVDSCWFASPIQQVDINSTLTVRLHNYGDKMAENVAVRLMINDIQRGQASLSLGPGAIGDVALGFTPLETGFQEGVLQIEDAPIVFDNKLYFSFEVRSTLPVMLINETEGSTAIQNLYQSDSAFDLSITNSINVDYSAFNQNDLIILNGLRSLSEGMMAELDKAIDAGKSIAVIPSEKANLSDYTRFFTKLGTPITFAPDTTSTKVNKVVTEAPLFFEAFETIPENADYPLVKFHYSIRLPNNSLAQNLIVLKGDNPFLTVVPVQAGFVYLFTSPLQNEFTTFANNELFIPTFINMALLSYPQNQLYGTLGQESRFKQNLPLGSSEAILHVKLATSEIDIIPQVQQQNNVYEVVTGQEFANAGNYRVFKQNTQIGGLSLNVSRLESDPYCWPADSLTVKNEKEGNDQVFILKDNDLPVSTALNNLSYGIRLWKVFVFLALLFLSTEVILLRFLK